MSYICKYCNNSFKRNSSLEKHILTAKYCLDIQNEKGLETLYKTYKCI